MQHELVENPIEHINGWLYPPINKPGLGIEVREDVVNLYRQ
jgi:L-alanine-DL-glutamate epimerase-like enolase superfamily enzyme